MLAHGLRRFPSIKPALVQRLVFAGKHYQTSVIYIGHVADGGPALDQHWVNVVFAGSVDKPHCILHIGVVPKRNYKLRLIHSLYCPQEPFNNINYKSH